MQFPHIIRIKQGLMVSGLHDGKGAGLIAQRMVIIPGGNSHNGFEQIAGQPPAVGGSTDRDHQEQNGKRSGKQDLFHGIAPPRIQRKTLNTDSRSQFRNPVKQFIHRVHFFSDILLVGNPEIKWHLLDGSEEIISMQPESESRYVTVKARKYGMGYLAATVEGIGTAILKIEVRKLLPARFMPVVASKEYTGEPVETTVMVLDEGNARMTEGQDYTLKFDNNVNCGIARVEICDPEGNSYEPQLFAYFAVKPQKAEITSVTSAADSITVTVADQWSSGISGYSIEYRESGSNQWNSQRMTEGNTIAITGLNSGNYDVRVRSFVDTSEAEKDVYCQDIYYGDYSETVSIVIK